MMHYFQLLIALYYAIFETEILGMKYVEVKAYSFRFYTVYVIPNPYIYSQL